MMRRPACTEARSSKSASSSPVARIPTRGRRETGISARPSIASTPISAGRSSVPACRVASRVAPVQHPDGSGVSSGLRMLDARHTVGAIWNRCPGHHLDRLAVSQRTRRETAGRHLLDQVQHYGFPATRTCHVCRADRVAVHSAVVPGRVFERRLDVDGEHAVAGFADRHEHVVQFHNRGEDELSGFINGQPIGFTWLAGGRHSGGHDRIRDSRRISSARSRSSGVFTFMNRASGSP